MVSDHQLYQAAILRAGTQPRHNLLGEWYARLRVIIEMDVAICACEVGNGFADVVQESGQFHARRCKAVKLEDTLLFRLAKECAYLGKRV